MKTPLLQIDDLTLAFRTPEGLAQTLDRVSIRVDDDEIMGFVGESGSGKSVTALSILGLLPAEKTVYSSGRIRYRGTDLLGLDRHGMERIRGRAISMVFQSPGNSLNPLIRIGDQMREVIRLHRSLTTVQIEREIASLNARVELPAWVLRAYPHELSGGMQQRASIAIAISCHPDLLIADEPTSSLDVSIQAQIIDLLRDLHRRRMIKAIIFITHDFGLVDELCDTVTVLYSGQVVETGDAQDVLNDPQHPYTHSLLDAIPKMHADGASVRPIQGTVPSLVSPPTGCRFNPRCRWAMDVCRSTRPALEEIGVRHTVACHLDRFQREAMRHG